MVMQYGMSEKVGAIRLGQEQGEVFLGRDMGHIRDYSEGVAVTVDGEVRKLIEGAHQEAYEILVENRDVLDSLVLELLEKETLDKAQVATVFEPLRKRSPRAVWLSASSRPVSDQGPVLTAKESGTTPGVPGPNGSNGSHGANGQKGKADAPEPAAGVAPTVDEAPDAGDVPGT